MMANTIQSILTDVSNYFTFLKKLGEDIMSAEKILSSFPFCEQSDCVCVFLQLPLLTPANRRTTSKREKVKEGKLVE